MRTLIAAISFAATLFVHGIFGHGIAPAAAQSFNERGPRLDDAVAEGQRLAQPTRYNTNVYNSIYGSRNVRRASGARTTGIYDDEVIPNSFNMRTIPSAADVFPSSSSQRRALRRPLRQEECEIVASSGFNEKTSLQTTC